MLSLNTISYYHCLRQNTSLVQTFGLIQEGILHAFMKIHIDVCIKNATTDHYNW